MKKKMRNDPDMLKEYDFSGGVRGKYARRYAAGANVVVVDPDVAEYFPDHDSVNQALRSLMAIIRRKHKVGPEVVRERASGVRSSGMIGARSGVREPRSQYGARARPRRKTSFRRKKPA